MRLIGWRFLVVSSVVALALQAPAETRPQYGGVLHIATRETLVTLDPGEGAQADSFARRSVTMLIADTLVTTDDNVRFQPSLAASWQAAAGNQKWQFHIRRGIKFHDGAVLTPESVAACLRAANPTWNIAVDGDSVVIDLAAGDPDLPAVLALPHNAVVKRNSDATVSGTGPFHIVDWQPGKRLTLAADENCWRGRPFLDGIEVEMGKSFRDQMTALETGKADLVEVAPEQVHRVSQDGRRLASSAPVELLALVFAREAATPDEKTLRQALALSVERGSIRSVLLQGAGLPTASILPNWMSGYGFIFPTEADLGRARQLREQVHTIPNWTLGYEAGDAVVRLIAERIALNARDAGLTLQPTTSATADAKLVRIALPSNPWVALAGVAMSVREPAGKTSGSVEDLYATERALLATERIVPLFHLPASYVAPGSLKNWSVRPDGSWAIADAWIGAAKP